MLNEPQITQAQNAPVSIGPLVQIYSHMNRICEYIAVPFICFLKNIFSSRSAFHLALGIEIIYYNFEFYIAVSRPEGIRSLYMLCDHVYKKYMRGFIRVIVEQFSIKV